MNLVCELLSVAMSASPQKLPPSNVTCRYWATSGTCFFGDQCNFAHDSADRAASGKSAVPKREKACKELLLTGYCKSEKNGCEYNHDISMVNPLRPPSSSTAAISVTTPVTFSSRASPTSPGTSAAIRSNRLPVSAPSFVPAAVAAAQRASLSAWGGVTPGSGKLITSGTSSQASSSALTVSMQNGQLSASSSQTSAVGTATASTIAVQSQDSQDSALVDSISSDTFVSTALTSTIDVSVLNPQSFVPPVPITSSVALDTAPIPITSGSGAQGPSIGGANAMPFLLSGGSVAAAVTAAPFVPKSKQNILSGGTATGGVTGGMGRGQALPAGQAFVGIGGGPQPQQISQMRQQMQQAQAQAQAQAQSQAQAQAQAHAHAHAHAHAQAQAQAQVQAQAQAQAQVFVAARGMGGTVLNSNYMTMEGPMVIPTFRLPDGDDPALGMTAMSPPNATFLARASSGISSLTSPERITSMGNLVREMPDAIGVLQLGGSSPFAHNFGGGLPSPSSIQAQQQYQHIMKMQLQQQQNLQQQAFSSQSPPYTLRSSQKPGPHTPEKQQLKPQAEYQAVTGQLSPYSIRLSQSLGAQTPEKLQLLSSQAEVAAVLEGRMLLAASLGPSTDRQGQDSDQLSNQDSEAGIPLQSPQQQAGHSESPQQHQSLMSVSQSMLKQHQHFQQALHQQQLRQKFQQQQQQNMLHQQMAQGQRPLSGPGQSQHRLPTTIRSSSPVSGVAPVAAATHGGATYFLGPGQGISSLPHAFNLYGGRNESRIVRGQFPAGTSPLGSRFLPDQLREELRRRHAMVHAQLDPEQDIVDLPEMVQRFHSLYPLEDVNREDEIPSSAFGVRTMIFKGISSSDGQAYAIRRIDSRQVIASEDLAATAIEAVERWAPLARHPHIVAIRESFVSREVEDTAALFFVHDFYPGALTLQRIHLQQEQAGGVVHLNVTEEQLWSYIVQLATVLRTVHGAGLFLRPGGLHPSKIIMPSKGRLHISGVGILDVLHGDPADDPRKFQREDLAGFGRLILTLACGSAASASLDFMSAHYSPDLVRITQALLYSSPEKSEGHGISNIRQLYPSLAERMFGEMENLHIQNDEVLNELSKETENGRLFRILVKLGMMNERLENDMDPGWSETGDRYLLKLFRDFVFHQSSEDGTPMIDWGHVVECLNKLDAGVPEKLILMSRDEQSLLIASYADLKRCLENAHQELLARASGDEIRPFLPQSILIQAQARFNQRQ